MSSCASRCASARATARSTISCAVHSWAPAGPPSASSTPMPIAACRTPSARIAFVLRNRRRRRLGVVARIVTGPHDANRQDHPHLPMRYDTGRPRAVIRLRISQPRTASLPCPAGLRARRSIVKLRLATAFDAHHGGFATGCSPVSWESIDEPFVNLTMPSREVRATPPHLQRVFMQQRHRTVMKSASEPKEPRPSGLRRARAPDVDERLDAQPHERGCQHHHGSL